jgi:fatty-acid desaturase
VKNTSKNLKITNGALKMELNQTEQSYRNERIDDEKDCNAWEGQVAFSPIKGTWVACIYLIGIVGGALTFSLSAFMLFLVTTAVTLCLGHSLGMHRRLIHQSYQCPKWLEYIFVHFGVLVGLAGPEGMMRTHDLRDWAQRQTDCHDYFAHRQAKLKDAYWQLFCDITLTHAPKFSPEQDFVNDKIYTFMEKTWMWQQLPWAILFFVLGGIDWLIWGTFVRVMVSVTGHWFIGYFAHNSGERHWHVEGAAVQGYNIKFASLMTMGECWHNNHHAYPGSAKLGLADDQLDPGWWVLLSLEKIGLVWGLVLPEHLLKRPELTEMTLSH